MSCMSDTRAQVRCQSARRHWRHVAGLYPALLLPKPHIFGVCVVDARIH